MVIARVLQKRGMRFKEYSKTKEELEKKTIALQVASACPPRPGLIYRFAKGQRLKTQGKVSRRHAWNDKSKLSELRPGWYSADIYEDYSFGLHTGNEKTSPCLVIRSLAFVQVEIG